MGRPFTPLPADATDLGPLTTRVQTIEDQPAPTALVINGALIADPDALSTTIIAVGQTLSFDWPDEELRVFEFYDSDEGPYGGANIDIDIAVGQPGNTVGGLVASIGFSVEFGGRTFFPSLPDETSQVYYAGLVGETVTFGGTARDAFGLPEGLQTPLDDVVGLESRFVALEGPVAGVVAGRTSASFATSDVSGLTAASSLTDLGLADTETLVLEGLYGTYTYSVVDAATETVGDLVTAINGQWDVPSARSGITREGRFFLTSWGSPVVLAGTGAVSGLEFIAGVTDYGVYATNVFMNPADAPLWAGQDLSAMLANAYAHIVALEARITALEAAP